MESWIKENNKWHHSELSVLDDEVNEFRSWVSTNKRQSNPRPVFRHKRNDLQQNAPPKRPLRQNRPSKTAAQLRFV